MCGVVTLCLTARHATVPYLPIEISKMGNFGDAYWYFAGGSSLTTILLASVLYRENGLTSCAIRACISLAGLAIVSDAGHFYIHIALTFSFFVHALLLTAYRLGRDHPVVINAVLAYGFRLLLTPLQILWMMYRGWPCLEWGVRVNSAPEHLQCTVPLKLRQFMAMFQWIAVFSLLVGCVMSPSAVSKRKSF
jgi:hypothetical protein